MEEKITVKIPLTKFDVKLALTLIGEELTPEIWDKIKSVNSEISFNAIEDQSERMQIKIGLAALLFTNIRD